MYREYHAELMSATLEKITDIEIKVTIEELVVKLKLSSRSTSEGFRQLEIAIDRGNLIRRVSGLTVGFKEHRFDFLNIRTNQNIPDARFEYDSPPFANVYQNFLYQPEN